ncbi:MAG TPA: hypothetical protein VH916_04905, partial [Dehalococcoidia bacterium]
MSTLPPDPHFTMLAPQEAPQEVQRTPKQARPSWWARLRALRDQDSGEQIAALIVCGMAAELFILILAAR